MNVDGFFIHTRNKVSYLTYERSSLLSTTVNDQDDTTKAQKVDKSAFIKNQREQIAKKPDFYRGAGVFKQVKEEVTNDMRRQFDSDLMNQMKENPNYMLEKDGVEFYLAKDHGFCWGGKFQCCQRARNSTFKMIFCFFFNVDLYFSFSGTIH